MFADQPKRRTCEQWFARNTALLAVFFRAFGSPLENGVLVLDFKITLTPSIANELVAKLNGIKTTSFLNIAGLEVVWVAFLKIAQSESLVAASAVTC